MSGLRTTRLTSLRERNPHQLEHLQLWWQGLVWLNNPESKLSEEILRMLDEFPKTKSNIISCAQISNTDDIFDRFLSFSHLKRVIAYCMRWRKSYQTETPKREHTLNVNELERALKIIIWAVQNRCFSQELINLKDTQRVKHKFIDNITSVSGQGRNNPSRRTIS